MKYVSLLSLISTIFFSSVSLSDVISDYGATHIWAGPSGNFSVAANWLTPSGEVSLDAPSEESVVYIPPGSICTVDKAFSVLKLAIGDVFNTESSSTVSITFKNGLSTNEVADTLQIGKNTTLTHDGNGSGSVAIQRITLKAGTSISVAKGAIFNLKGKGFNSGKGPAAGGAGKGGGTHAGVGGNNTYNTPSVNSAKCYGSIRRPLMPGSGGTTAGGGVVHLISPGPIQFDGQIDATGANGQNYLNGAGGSAFIEAGTFLGTGTIDVRSGTPNASYALIGGSGRISVVESKATSFGFQGTLNASSLKKRCGPGTVYLEDASHVPGQGDLIVDGFSVKPDSDCVCRLDTTVEGAQDPFGSVTVKRGARLNIPSSVTLKVIKSISTTGGYLTTASTGGAIEFLPASGGVIDVAGTISAYALYCTNSTSATIRFANSSVLETFANGKAEFDSIEGVLSMVPATTEGKWTYAIGESASVKANNIAISNCTASAISFSAIASEDLGGNVNCNILSKPKPGDLIKWTGTQNNQWANPNNWSPARVPNETDVVLISASAVNQPVISGNSVLVNSVTNEQGATLTLSGVNLTVTNNLVSSGSIVIGNNEKLIVSGNGNQIVNLDNTTVKRLFIEKNGGSVAFKKGFKILETFKCNTSNDLLFVFEAGEVYDINQLFVDGMVLNEESGVDCKIAFVSSTLNSKWFLRATNSQRVRGVTVSDCDASIGKTINVGVFAKEEQPSSNINWNFAEDAASEWVGSKNTTFTTSANWLLEKIPNENTSVTVMPKVNQTHTLIVSQETKIKNLILGGDDGTVSFTADAKLIVQEDFDVRSKATAVLNFYNQPNEVFNLIVRRGGKITHGSSTTSAVKKLNIEASGDIIVQSGGIISADGVAQGGTSNESTGWAIGASHGGVGCSSDQSKVYGSVFEPYDTGSKGVGGNGGGVVKLTALNKIHISGRVTAYGYVPQGGGGGSGGSVWLTAGVISGDGRVGASSLTDYENETSYNYTGGGGRIAFYQTQANDWSEFHVSVNCAGAMSGQDGGNKGGQGTIYWQLPTDVHHGGRISITPPVYIARPTVLPGTKDGDVRKAYKDATLELGANANVVIASSSLTQLGGVMQLKDIDIKSTSAKIALNENTLKVLSQAHRNGRNWTQNRDYEASVAAGQINTTLGGKIIWPIGFSVNIR